VRRTFVSTLVDLAADDERIVLLTGDLGFTVVEPFAEAYPNRFFNVGVAEQNMVGVATGLADGGYVPYVYSIATFATLRPYEFIRNGPILQRLPVRIIGVGGGLEYGSNGPSHYALEDLALMRVQPGMTVLAPADFAQAQEALRVSSALSGPVYFRLGKDDTTTVRGLEGRFQLGRA
jgi:transketolase